MTKFEESGLSIDSVLEAIVLGGNVAARTNGARKRLLQVTTRQALLARSVAENGGKVGFDVLQTLFPRNWKRINDKHKDLFVLQKKRLFFRNISRMTERINDKLAAGYVDAECRPRMLSKTADRYFGLVYSYQLLDVGFFLADTLEDFLEIAPFSADGKRFLSRRDIPPGGDGEGCPPTRDAPEASTRTSPEAPAAEPQESGPGDVDGVVASSSCDDLTADALSGPEDAFREPAGTEISPTSGHVQVELFDFEEDELTGAWSFILDGHRIEIRRDLGYVSVEGRLFPADYVRQLKRPTEIEGEVLAGIRRCILAVRVAE